MNSWYYDHMLDESTRAVDLAMCDKYNQILLASRCNERAMLYLEKYGCDEAFRMLAPDDYEIYREAGMEGFFEKIVNFVKMLISKIVGFGKMVLNAILNGIIPGRAWKQAITGATLGPYANNKDAQAWFEALRNDVKATGDNAQEMKPATDSVCKHLPGILKFITADHAAMKIKGPNLSYSPDILTEKAKACVDAYKERLDSIEKMLEAVIAGKDQNSLQTLSESKSDKRVSVTNRELKAALAELRRNLEGGAEITVKQLCTDQSILNYYRKVGTVAANVVNTHKDFFTQCTDASKRTLEKVEQIKKQLAEKQASPETTNKVTAALTGISKEVTDPNSIQTLKIIDSVNQYLAGILLKVLSMKPAGNEQQQQEADNNANNNDQAATDNNATADTGQQPSAEQPAQQPQQ